MQIKVVKNQFLSNFHLLAVLKVRYFWSWGGPYLRYFHCFVEDIDFYDAHPVDAAASNESLSLVNVKLGKGGK